MCVQVINHVDFRQVIHDRITPTSDIQSSDRFVILSDSRSVVPFYSLVLSLSFSFMLSMLKRFKLKMDLLA
jgi:hypothetical protein